ARRISLADSLPTAVTVDLSAVSLPVHQTIDQVVQWTREAVWPLCGDLPSEPPLPACVQDFLAKCAFGDSPRTAPCYEQITIYTDGSYDGAASSWSFCAFGSQGDRTTFIGWSAGQVHTDAADPLFLQPCRHSALCGEQHAILWAAIWLMQSPRHFRSHLVSDCLVALQQATGTFGWSDADSFAPLCRAAMQAACSARPTLDSEISHVRSHQGHPANELADHLAKSANRGHGVTPTPHQLWAAEWIRQGALAWLWVQIEAAAFPDMQAFGLQPDPNPNGVGASLRVVHAICASSSKVQESRSQHFKKPDQQLRM
ncbi:unnamed protein product, partial [Symbiodinium necroappetens]